MRLVLTLIDGEEIEYQMVGHAVTIGRSNKCDLVIAHEAMSRQHCKIEVREGEVFITDLGSINGVMIDGKKIPANSSVPFQTYLHLAFGAVQSAQFEVDEVTRLGIVKPNLNPTSSTPISTTGATSTKTRTKSATPIKVDNKSKAKPKPSEDKGSKSLMVNIAAFVGILFAIYYFVYADKPDSGSASETQAAPTGAPAKPVETSDHF